jgi:D-alanyl-D-alanine carboxypeptidase
MIQISYPRRGFIALAISTLLTPKAFADEPSSDTNFTRAATTLVERSEREDDFSGVILVARGDKVLLRQAAGFADRGSNLRNRVETQFPILSISKQFTAAAIMLLVEDGKIALDDSILKFHPEAPAEWRGITIRHLLTHSSGIGDQFFNEANMAETQRYISTHDDIVPFLTSAPLLFQPGSGFQYSNAGYVILAELIAHTSGVSFEKFMTDRIFMPLGMSKTGFQIASDIKGYIPASGGGLKDAPVYDKLGPDGAGGIYSTADDMLRWSQAWDEGKILSAASRAAALTDYGYTYGFGWRFAPKFGRKLVWHTGSFGQAGFASVLDRFPDEKTTFIVLSNALATTGSTATLVIEGKETTFPAIAARKLLDVVEALYFIPGRS